MDKLQVRNTESLSVKAKALEDARQMQTSVIEAATKSGKEPPKYALLELIGKGSFGRVYKGYVMHPFSEFSANSLTSQTERIWYQLQLWR